MEAVREGSMTGKDDWLTDYCKQHARQAWHVRWIAAIKKLDEANDCVSANPDSDLAELARWEARGELSSIEKAMAKEFLLMFKKAIGSDADAVKRLVWAVVQSELADVYDEIEVLKSTFRTEVRQIIAQEREENLESKKRDQHP